MSNAPEPDLDLDLLFLPAWAQKAPDKNRYAQYEGESKRGADRKWDRKDRPPRRTAARGPGTAPRPQSGDRPQSARWSETGRGRTEQPGGRATQRPERPSAPPEPLPEINVALVPDDKGVDSLAKQIKMTGRAYPLFEIAQMILQKPERHWVTFSVRKNPDGAPIQPLFVCALDDTLWLSEEEAVSYVLDKHFTTFYQPDRTKTEPPKGTYTFVAQCGLSGVVLGPPNYHDYQNQLRKLHAERFSRMPFEAFKARVRIVRDEAVVKQWLEEQSWKTEYICLNLPETLKLASREEVEKHFRQTHQPNIIKPAESYRLTGAAAHNLRDPGLKRLLRHAWEEQRRFPLQLATVLSQQFATRGLQFFKVNKTVTHVAVARPHFLDLETTPVSESIKRIIHYINSNSKCPHRQLLDALAPMPADSVEPTPERTAVTSDLHWLIHQGHVIEFASGILETTKKPIFKPQKPAVPPLQSGKTETLRDTGASTAIQTETAPGESALGEVQTSVSEPSATDQLAAPVESVPAAAASADRVPGATAATTESIEAAVEDAVASKVVPQEDAKTPPAPLPSA